MTQFPYLFSGGNNNTLGLLSAFNRCDIYLHSRRRIQLLHEEQTVGVQGNKMVNHDREMLAKVTIAQVIV